MYQHESERALLERLRAHFGRGELYHKGPNSSVSTYSVSRLDDLGERVIPFFEQHPLPVKDDDFQTLATIVRSMRRKEHLHPDGFDHIVRLAYAVNAHGIQRARPIETILQGSSETVRQAPR